jgi:hypothetical protein
MKCSQLPRATQRLSQSDWRRRMNCARSFSAIVRKLPIDHSLERKLSTTSMSRVAWWIIKLASGVVAIYGAIVVGWSLVELFYLITGRIQADFEQASIALVMLQLVIGLALVVGGHGAPKWLNVDRLL